MPRNCLLLLAGLLTLAAGRPACAQADADSAPQRLAALLKNYESSRYAAKGAAASNPTTVSLRGGGMISPRGAALIGIDVAMPNVSIPGTGWHGRFDVDAIITANFGGSNTVVPF